MADTFTGIELYSNKAIQDLRSRLAPLKLFSTDYSDDLADTGANLSVPLVEADTAGAFGADNNFSRSAFTPKNVALPLGDPMITGFAVTALQAAKIRRAFWEGKADLNAATMADTALAKISALFTKANYAKVYTGCALDAFNNAVVAKIAAAAAKRANGLDPSKCVLVLSSEYYYALAGTLSAEKYGGPEVIQNGVVPRLYGFKAVMELPRLDIAGAVVHPAAIACGSRAFRPVDDKPYTSVRDITEPDTGITMTLVEYPDGANGTLSESLTGFFAAAVGNGKAAMRIIAGSTDA